MVQQSDFDGNTSHDSTQASVDLDVTTASNGQFENEEQHPRGNSFAPTKSKPEERISVSLNMHRSRFAKSPTPSNTGVKSVVSPPKPARKESATYVSEVMIHLAGNTREVSPQKLSTSQTRLSPQRKVSDNSLSTPEKNNSKESLSTSVWSQVSTKPVEGTPRTSTPELRKSVNPRVERQSISGFHHESSSTLSKVESRADRRRPFYDSTASNGLDSTQGVNGEKINIPPLELTTQQSDLPLKKHWYYDLLQRIEDLSWSYQNLEVEYSFLETLMAEQKEDLKKAKSWNKRLRNQNATGRPTKVH